MPELESRAQHITELDFDISQIPKQFEELERWVQEEGLTLRNLAAHNWDFTAILRENAAQAAQASGQSAKKMQTSWANAYKILRGMGDPMAGVSDLLRQNGRRTAVVWTQEMEEEFRKRAPELKKQLSEWVQWVKPGEGVSFDGMLSNSLRELVPDWGDAANQLDLLERLNEGLQQYKATARQLVETGSMFSSEIDESERMRAAYDLLSGKAKEFYRVRREGFTPGEADSAKAYSDIYRYLEGCAVEATALSNTEAKIKVQLNENGEIRKASIAYTDQEGRSVRQVYGWYERLNNLTGEAERAFGSMGATVVDDKLARANETARELALNAHEFEAAYQQANKSIGQSVLAMQKSGFDQEQIDVVQGIAQKIYQLEKSSGEITKDTLEQMKNLQAQAETAARIVRQQKERKELAAAEKSGREKVYALDSKIANLQKQIRLTRVDTGDLSSEAAKLREQTDEMKNQLAVSGKLTAEQKRRLSEIEEQTAALKNRAGVAIADNAPPTAGKGSALGGYLATQAVSAARSGAREVAKILKDVEYSMMEVSRVLGLSGDAVGELRGQLFGLAQDYGRSFEDVSEIMLRFVQAGYSAKESIGLTRDALLALNTAELNVQNSTQSMIGILGQWDMDGSKLIEIIDKLNYTADNNAITTQDLVDGLLNASSVAKTANMTFDQTVGVLTAMKEASGRSGKEVGNAFKSILSYIQRDKSLQAFDAMGIEVFADRATGALLPMMDILSNMAAKWGGMSEALKEEFVESADMAELFNEQIAIDTGTLDEYGKAQEAMAAATDKANDAETRAQANQAAGVYRRNYYIALMENMSKAYAVVGDLQNAEGHSMRENGRYMDTLSAKGTQLIASLKELAVVSADNGLMDLAKGLLDAATAMTQFLTNTNGAAPAISGVAAALLSLSKNVGENYAEAA